MASNNALLASKLFSVKGLKAVVTGGGTGIGLMATQALATNGATVYIVGRRKEALDNVVSTYSKGIEGKIIALPGDVRDKADLARIAKVVEEAEGGIHLLFNNAGISGPKSRYEGTPSAAELQKIHADETFEGWADVFSTNVSSVFFTTMVFLPLLEKFTHGQDAAGRAIYEKYATGVITTSSISGITQNNQNHFAYNSVKAATIHLHSMLASNFSHLGIRFNSIAPGVFPSEMTGKDADENQKVDIKDDFDPSSLSVPQDRAGSDEDMAATILYLTGRGGQYTNGVIIPVDGGTLLNNR